MCSVGHNDQRNECIRQSERCLNLDWHVIIGEYLCLPVSPPPVCSVHFSIESFQWRLAVKVRLRGVNEMLGIGWLPHQPSHAFDDVATPVFNRPLVIIIQSHILEGV